ncbi:hypothetical protein [Halosimplex halophilum]|uniref:hypothetical protein n=1 Tax=Halosimplex halophilum TaxID=2559572 RepID=UPI00107F29D4|nr:hypothetical protein [Halosimplex halophilum]
MAENIEKEEINSQSVDDGALNSQSTDEESSWVRFIDENLKDTKDIKLYTKSKYYAKIGKWGSGISLYMLLAMYVEHWPSNKLYVAVSGGLSILAITLTVLFRLNAKKSDINDDLVSRHVIASLLSSFDSGGSEKLVETYEKWEGKFRNNPYISKKRRQDFDSYIEDIQEKEGVHERETKEYLDILVDETQSVVNHRFSVNDEIESSSDETQEKKIGFMSVLRSSVDSENINTSYVFWALFFIAAIVGTIVALWKGQSWGVLTVTILMGALRFYDKRNS